MSCHIDTCNFEIFYHNYLTPRLYDWPDTNLGLLLYLEKIPLY